MQTKKKYTQPAIDKETTPGRHSVGAGLYLLVKPTGAKTWVFRYRDRVSRKLRDHGLGSSDAVLLSTARERALQLRAGLSGGGNPIDDKKARLSAARKAKAGEKTFGFCAEQCIAKRQKEWKNGADSKHGKQWVSTLADYCRDWTELPIVKIDVDMVEAVLEPRWNTTTETASRVQMRIAEVFDWAISHGHFTASNPAKWRGNLKARLTAPSKIKQVKHREALPHNEIYRFLTELSEKDTRSAKSLMLQVLTATRPGESTGARWEEFDMDARTWTIPASRTKTKAVHVVPLPMAVVSLLKRIDRDESGFLFPGVKGKPITTDAVLNMFKAMRPGMTCHGFRSSFSDWAAENTNEPIVTEAALGHKISSAVIAAYRRTNLIEKRRPLMTKWATYCFTEPKQNKSVSKSARKHT